MSCGVERVGTAGYQKRCREGIFCVGEGAERVECLEKGGNGAEEKRTSRTRLAFVPWRWDLVKERYSHAPSG
jgi:hypothetical protein